PWMFNVRNEISPPATMTQSGRPQLIVSPAREAVSFTSVGDCPIPPENCTVCPVVATPPGELLRKTFVPSSYERTGFRFTATAAATRVPWNVRTFQRVPVGTPIVTYSAPAAGLPNEMVRTFPCPLAGPGST